MAIQQRDEELRREEDELAEKLLYEKKQAARQGTLSSSSVQPVEQCPQYANASTAAAFLGSKGTFIWKDTKAKKKAHRSSSLQ